MSVESKIQISRFQLEHARWWALIRFARWLGVRWQGVAPHERWRLETRIWLALRGYGDIRGE